MRRAIGRVVVDGLMSLAGGAAMPQVRAVAAQHLGWLKATAEDRSRGDDHNAAHFALLARDIQRFEERPHEAWAPAMTPSAPPGAPIGTAPMDWMGFRTGLGGQLTAQAGLADLTWLDKLVPFCAYEQW